MNDDVEVLETENDNSTQVTTQVSASTPVPQLSIPDQAPVQEVPATPINEVSVVETKDPNAQDQTKTVEAKIEAAQVNIDIPKIETISPVEVKDTDGDGIPDSNEDKKSELIESTELAKVENVTKSKGKIKINFGKKTIPLMIGLIGIVLAFIIGLSVGSIVFSKPIYGGNCNPVYTQTSDARVIDGKNNITIAGNYTFKVPEAYYFDKTNQGLLVYDTTGTFRIYIRGQEGIYDDIANAKTSVKATLTDNELNVISIKEVKINKHPYIIAETSDGLKNRMIAFTSAGSTEVFFVEIITSDDNFNYNALDLADDILTNAAYKEGKSELEDTGVKDIASVVIAAANTYKSIAGN